MEFRQFKWVTGNANESPCWRIKRKPEKAEKLSPENVWRRQDTAFFVGQKPRENKGQDIAPP